MIYGFLAGFSLAVSLAAFVFALLSYRRQNYTPEAVQTFVNNAMQRGYQAAITGQIPVPIGVPVRSPVPQPEPENLQTGMMEPGFQDGQAYETGDFIQQGMDEFRKAHPDLAKQWWGMS